MTNTIGHAGIYSVEMTNTFGHGEIYSVETTNTIGHDEIYSVEMASTVGHAEIHSVGKGIIDVGMVLHIDKIDITVVTTFFAPCEKGFYRCRALPHANSGVPPACRDRPRVCPNQCQFGLPTA